MASSIQGVSAASAVHDTQPHNSGAAARVRVPAASNDAQDDEARRSGRSSGHSTCLCYQCQAALSDDERRNALAQANAGASAGAVDYTEHLKKAGGAAHGGLLAGGYRWFHQTAAVERPAAVVDTAPSVAAAADAKAARAHEQATSGAGMNARGEPRGPAALGEGAERSDGAKEAGETDDRGRVVDRGAAAGADDAAPGAPGAPARKVRWQLVGDGQRLSLARSDPRSGAVDIVATQLLPAGRTAAATPAAARAVPDSAAVPRPPPGALDRVARQDRRAPNEERRARRKQRPAGRLAPAAAVTAGRTAPRSPCLSGSSPAAVPAPWPGPLIGPIKYCHG